MLETYVISHKKDFSIEENHIHIVRVGNYENAESVLCDNTGDNIANLNGSFDEMTAIYWLYKHYDEIGNPDYIGIQQYRRFFYTKDNKFSYYESDYLDEFAKDNIKIDDDFEKLFDKYDMIVPCPMKVSSVREQFGAMHQVQCVDLALDIIEELSIDYLPVAKDYFDEDKSYLFNMFIFDKQTFFEYCEWIFKILFEYQKRTTNKGRYFISERLTGIFITKKIKEGSKALHMPIIYISGNPTLKQTLEMCKINRQNKLKFKQVIKPFLVKIMPKSIWLKWKRRQFELL